ncbi:Ig-specific serine endopeptidase MIP [Mycoplasmopsis californica]|uniref:Ig-specific serine endopeptidase MIP n=1 Tax=Mycoplasmopsis californica TaxID=2113 RepID=UPI0006452488|nr:DUF31 family protein [Mycoplasmopsis californica]BBG41066.1 hypothetical protein MCAL106_0775 [Mycoplasmopsis californica]BBG41659.1 hypothetical protein MCAL106E_0775 [Mycoplasmopsis californica]BBG42253.1 hypothetical protein MCAL106L_0775 [Mycoplasmopsis californica]
MLTFFVLVYSDVLKLFEKEIENQKNDAKTYNRIKAPRGTMWIMDYKISENGKYPTKWYFGTNSHVARDIMQPGFSSISMSVMKPNVGLLTRFRILGLDEKFITYGWDDPKVKQAVKRVYDATDYLKTSPKGYLDSSQKEKFASIEEMIDFAVVEIDFDILASIHNKLVAWSNEKSVEIKPMSGEELARLVTNDYASRDPKDKVKFLANSYLKNYNKIDFELQYPEANGPRKTDELFALGYPGAIYDYFLRKHIDQDQIDRAKDYQTLWTNSDYRFFSQRPIQEGGKPSVDEKKLNRGNYLSYNIGFRTFIDKPGLNDGFIANPVRGNEIYSTFDEEGKQKQYWNTGLQYMLRHFVGREGSSGSSVRNQNNEIIGVHSSIAPDSKTDFVSAFRSEGYDYKGVYGKYNLPQYDLIYGGGKDQKTSYRQALEKMYKGQNYKTYIFQNGTDENNIPNEFKFDKIKLLNQ